MNENEEPIPTTNQCPKCKSNFNLENGPNCNCGFNVYEHRLEGLRLTVSRYHHQDTRLWTQFNNFISLMVIGTSVMGVIFLIMVERQDFLVLFLGTLSILSFLLSIIAVFWHHTISRCKKYLDYYRDDIQDVQRIVKLKVLQKPQKPATSTSLLVKYFLRVSAVLFGSLGILFGLIFILSF